MGIREGFEEMRISVNAILGILNDYEVEGNIDNRVSRALPITEADSDSVAFVTKERVDLATNTKAKIIIGPKGVDIPFDWNNQTLIRVPNPRLSFCRILNKFFAEKYEPQIHPSSTISEGISIHASVYIGPNCRIGKNCEIGEDTVIEGNSFVYPNTKIGKHVIIHTGAVIGAQGFGFERDEENKWVKFPQIGGLVIEDDVEISFNTCVERGALGNTVIGEGTKIDNLVSIGHNARIGKHNAIEVLTNIGGSVVIGDHNWIAPLVCVRDWITIGNRNIVGMGAVVTKNIPDDIVVFGVPAKEMGKNIPFGRSLRK